MTLDSLLEAVRDQDHPAAQWISANGWPTSRNESWHYAPLKAITTAAGSSSGSVDGVDGVDGPDAIKDLDIEALLGELPDGIRVVLVNGRYEAELSDVANDSNLVVDTVGRPEQIPAEEITDLDGFGALNLLADQDAVRIRVGSPTDQVPTVVVVHIATDGGTYHPRVDVSCGDNRRVSLVELYRSVPGTALVNATTDIDLGVASELDHLVVVDGAELSAHVTRTHLSLPASSVVRSATVSLGAGTVRRDVSADFSGDGATVSFSGLTIPSSGAHHDTIATVRHNSSNCVSHQQFASIVPANARSSFTGQVVVAKATSGTDADQQSRNMLLAPSARADSRPWLEIHSDEVACAHGATVGALDEEGLFYLRSRGISEDHARTMLLNAFASTAAAQLVPEGPISDWVNALTSTALGELVTDQRDNQGDTNDA